MAYLRENLFVCLSVIVVFLLPTVSSHTRHAYYTPPKVTRITDLFTRVSIPHEYSTVFGEPNVKLINNGSYVNLALDKISGSGLRSKNKYYYGFFSAAIKLPPGLTSGVVVAFYLSNAETYPHNHDEIDIELLGHDKRRDWMFQTNVYANGTSGREEKFYLWFDPTQAYHQYSIIWNSYHTVFFVDNIPVREFKHSSAYTTVYPSKPMSVYATIWDGSEWATHGGKYPVNYKYGPFVASFGDTVVAGCNSSAIAKAPPCSKSNSPSGLDPVEGDQFIRLSKDQVQAMDWARRKLMLYSYCNDRARFKVMPPECI